MTRMSRLNWGLIGGGAGSQIGPIHRIAAAIDGEYELTAGALDIGSAKTQKLASSLPLKLQPIWT